MLFLVVLVVGGFPDVRAKGAGDRCAQLLVFQGQAEQGMGTALTHGGLFAAKLLHAVLEGLLAVGGFGSVNGVLV